MGYLYTMEYYLAIKKNIFEFGSSEVMYLEPVIQSEVKKRKINTICIFKTSSM